MLVVGNYSATDLDLERSRLIEGEELDRYFAMNKSEQKSYLDERINRMLKMRANTNQKANAKKKRVKMDLIGNSIILYNS